MKKLFVLGMAALLLVAFSVPAMAEVKIGGIVFTDFYYLDRDKENAALYGHGKSGDSYTRTNIDINPITRLYARWTNEDNVGMYIEFGLGGANGSTGTSLRHAYGWWDVNPMFQIMAGHSTTPFSPLDPSQLLGVNAGSLNIIGIGYGDFYSGRFPQIRGTFEFSKNVRLAIALVDPHGTAVANGEEGPWPSYETNTRIPRIDIGVPIYVGPVHIYPSFLWQKRSVDLAPGFTGDDDINTYVGSLGFKAGFGPFGIAAEGQWGENWGNTRGQIGGLHNPAAVLANATLKNNGQIHDAETYGFWVDLSYTFGAITPHLMYGQMKSENETAAGLDQEAKTQMYGISVPIDLAKGFRVRPELMWYDDGDTSTAGFPSVDNGKYLIAGVQFQITF